MYCLPHTIISITNAAARNNQASFPQSVGGSEVSLAGSSFHPELVSSSNRDWLSGVVLMLTRAD
jgi:hypothetical protein